ncbi:hypothetical protein RND81_06G031900 [Saponaria officinalis]|uniref:DUF3615 domain-containing protein n=1 Tax=Saponaria officinalis TaxID=3572 RepID=A0AAW1K972_SAPOF
MKTILESLTEPMEFDSREDSNTRFDNSSNRSHSTDSPPPKRPRLRRLSEFTSAKEFEELKSVAAEVVELKDYAEWFMSRSEANLDDFLLPDTYWDWFCTLGTEAKEKAILIPQSYLDWYLDVMEGEIEPPDFVGMDTWEQQIRRYGELALAHFKETGRRSEDYEDMSHTGAWNSGYFLHFNFSARLKVSESRLEPGPLRLFFAEMRSTNDEVTYCCILEDSILDSILNSEEYGHLEVVHPPGFVCSECLGSEGYEDYVCCS